MKLWDILGDGGFWKVQLDVRDLGGHLDLTYRGNLSHKVGKATFGVAAVRCQQVFKSSWAWYVVGIFLLASTLLKLHMSPPLSSVLFLLPLFGQFGPLRCLLPLFLDILLSSWRDG